MPDPDQHQSSKIAHAFADVLSYFDGDKTAAIDAARLARYDAARRVLLNQPEAAAHFLAGQFSRGSFARKHAAYDLLIALGADVLAPIRAELDAKGPIAHLWLISVLHFHHDASRDATFIALLGASNVYARHLAALAIVFQGLNAQADPDTLLRVLIAALASDRQIEGSAFYVADSALSCIRWLTGQRFGAAQSDEIQVYNFNDYVFEPPVLPFPFTSDRLASLPQPEREALVQQISDWWQHHRGQVQLQAVTGCFDQ